MLQKFTIKQSIKKMNLGDFSIRFWDGEELKIGNKPSKFSIIFNKKLQKKDLYKDMSLTFGLAYMNGIIDIQGDYDELCRVLYLKTNQKFLHKHDKTLSKIKPLQESKNIKSHYDIGNDFYKLWLDDTLSYSCAYFKSKDDSLKEAQLNKIDHTLKKLDLQKGQKLLDIGCGWGYLAIKAAQTYNVNVVGITISQEQYQKATQRVKELNLSDKIEIKLQNYQDLDYVNEFDKVVSVGMFEHVGKKNLPLYFMRVKQALKPSGIFLLHSIMSPFEGKTNTWIDKYIFPGGYLPSLREVVSIMNECDFHLLLGESLRMHYAKTLDIWLENFYKVKDKVKKMYDLQFVRMWELYLKTCASAFRVGSADIFQLLISKNVNNEFAMTKDYIYA